MSKGERMETHTERTESDNLSARNSSAKEENENSTHCVLNLERFARFITERVMNFSPWLKTPQKTREHEFGTRCVPNFFYFFNGLADTVKYRKAKAWNHEI